MKTPFKKLRELGLHRHDKRHRHKSPAQFDELSQATQDMQDMKDCYDSLLSAAANTANSAYEFSESLREMGDCLLEKTSLNDDEDSGRVLLMLGKVQLEIQKLLDNYRSHISRTITVPSESLLNELRIVEDMKKQCDEKRMSYEVMRTKSKEKGRFRSSKGERYSSHQLQVAQDEFDEGATLFVFRMKSLKSGQSHSLLTQAVRHHAAQMCFFRKALKSLEAIEPSVKLVTEQQHIDYQFGGLEDDDRDSVFLTEDEDDEDDSDDDENDMLDDGELSFEYQRNDQKNEVPSSGNSMELDGTDLTFPQFASVNSAKANMYKRPIWKPVDLNAGSKSAPLYPDQNERFRQLRQSSSRKLNTYVLPTPLEKSPVSPKSDSQSPQSRPKPNFWHSSPLDQMKNENVSRNSQENKSTSGPIPPRRFSGSFKRPPSLTPPASTDLSSLSAKFISSPKISELHELPRPPANQDSKKALKDGFSAPLVTFKGGPLASSTAATLPMPSGAITRSQSIPSTSQRETEIVSKSIETQNLRTDGGMSSPPRS